MANNVYFPVCDPMKMCDYCREHGLSVPELYAEQIHGSDYYKSTFEVWQVLYVNLPYDVLGCYPL